MPFAAALWGFFISIIPTVVGRVLLSLGFGYVAYSGIDLLMTGAKTALLSRITGSGAIVVQLAGVLQVGTCINILASAVAARLVVAGITNGVLTKMVSKG
jgi:hypothetical protein